MTEVDKENDAETMVDTGNELTVETLTEELAKANAKAEENWNLFLRARAETDNVQRRARVDVENAHKYSAEKFSRELLMVLDSFERGLEIAQTPEATVAGIKEGTELTYKLLLDTFEKFGIKQSNPIGETFNPAMQEAVSIQATDTVAPNTILLVAQKGFLIHDRVLRPARVIVSRAPESTKMDNEA